VDAIDAVLVRLSGNGLKTKVKIIDFITSCHLASGLAIFKNSDNNGPADNIAG
jgi:hypothetical protein